jgi:hypothetical protein
LADFAKCLIKEGLWWSLLPNAFGEPQEEAADLLDATKELEFNNFTTICDKAASLSISRAKQSSTSKSDDSKPISAETLHSLAQGGNTDRLLDAAATVGKKRARFVTASGMRGIGPLAMDLGDRVCVLYGANVPFICGLKEKETLMLW